MAPYSSNSDARTKSSSLDLLEVYPTGGGEGGGRREESARSLQLPNKNSFECRLGATIVRFLLEGLIKYVYVYFARISIYTETH